MPRMSTTAKFSEYKELEAGLGPEPAMRLIGLLETMEDRIVARQREELATKLDLAQQAAASRDDLFRVERDLSAQTAAQREDMMQQMAALREDMTQQMAALREDMMQQMAALRQDMTQQMAALREETTRQIASLKLQQVWFFAAILLAIIASNRDALALLGQLFHLHA